MKDQDSLVLRSSEEELDFHDFSCNESLSKLDVEWMLKTYGPEDMHRLANHILNLIQEDINEAYSN